MSSSASYSLWLRPFGEVAIELKKHINKLSSQFNTPGFEPHVTLLGGLDAHETRLIQLTDTLAHALAPFTIQLEETGFGDQYFQSLFIRAKKSDPLISAHNLAIKMFGYENAGEYIPHLSLLYGELSVKKKSKILNTMGRNFNLQFDVHNVLLIKTGDRVDGWKKIHTAEFSKNA